MDIVAFVTQRLGIDESQAKGAIGLLLNFAKSKLGEERFSQLSQYVPGAEQMIAAAPESGGLASALGGIASAFGGGESAGKLADLAGGLSKVGLKADDIGGLVSTVTDYFQEDGKTEAASLLKDVLK